MRTLLLTLSITFAFISAISPLHAQFQCHTSYSHKLDSTGDSYQSKRLFPSQCNSPGNYEPDLVNLDRRPILTLQVNVHYIQKMNGSGNYPETGSPVNGVQFAQDFIDRANYLMRNNTAMNYPNVSPPPVLPVHLQFELAPNPNDPTSDGVYFWPAPDAHFYYCRDTNDNCPRGGTMADIFSIYENLYTAQQGNVINIFFLDHSDPNYTVGAGRAESSGGGTGDAIKVLNSWETMQQNLNNPTSVVNSMAGTLMHEVGHLLGLRHIFEYAPCYGIPWGVINKGTGNNIMDEGGGLISWIPCQIGAAHRDIYQFELPFVKKDYCVYDANKTVTINSGEDILWAGSRYLSGDLIIESGAKLTLCCKLGMPAGSKIIVEPGGQFIVDAGQITNVCEEFWKGIEVQGDKTQHQFTSTPGNFHQGYVELKNGAIIEHARDGVWLEDGGIIVANEAEFLNNRRSIAYLQYQNTRPGVGVFPNVGRFEDCQFMIDDDYRGNNDFFGHVTMWDVAGVSFHGCNFRNETTDISGSPTKLGRAIHTVDAQFNVLPACNSTISPCPSIDERPTVFNNFHRAIEVTQSGSNRSFNIRNAVFTNNWYGIYSHNVSRFTCFNSIFALGGNKLSSNQQNQTGIYTNAGHGFKIEENLFLGISDMADCTGIHIENSGSSMSRIYRNTFESLNNRGIFAKGNNFDHTYSTNTGLDFLCNNFNDAIPFDILVEQDEEAVPGISGIRFYQGDYTLSAGNCFSVAPNQAEDDLRHINDHHSFVYWHEDADCKTPLEWSPNNVFPFGGILANECVQNEYTETLIVSDDRISELEDRVTEQLNVYSALSENYDGIPTTEGEPIAAQIGTAYSNAIASTDELLLHYFNDKEQPYQVSKVEQTINRIQNPEFQYDLLKAYLEQNRTDEAAGQLQYLTEAFDWSAENTALENMQSLNQLWLALKTSDRTIAACNPEEVNLLHMIAQAGRQEASAEARGILNFFYDGQYLVTEEYVEQGLSPEHAVFKNKAVAAINVYPNPFQSTFTISFLELPTKAGHLEVFDLAGMRLQKIPYAVDQRSVEINLQHQPAGIYLISATLNDEMLRYKLIKQ